MLRVLQSQYRRRMIINIDEDRLMSLHLQTVGAVNGSGDLPVSLQPYTIDQPQGRPKTFDGSLQDAPSRAVTPTREELGFVTDRNGSIDNLSNYHTTPAQIDTRNTIAAYLLMEAKCFIAGAEAMECLKATAEKFGRLEETARAIHEVRIND